VLRASITLGLLEMNVDQCGTCGGGQIVVDVGYGSRFDFALSFGNAALDACDDCIEEILKMFGVELI